MSMLTPFLTNFSCCFTDSLDNGWDMTQLKEEEFEEFCVYIVHDLACEKVCPNRAQATMPRNLTLKPSLTQVDNVSFSFLYTFFFFLSSSRTFLRSYVFVVLSID